MSEVMSLHASGFSGGAVRPASTAESQPRERRLASTATSPESNSSRRVISPRKFGPGLVIPPQYKMSAAQKAENDRFMAQYAATNGIWTPPDIFYTAAGKKVTDDPAFFERMSPQAKEMNQEGLRARDTIRALMAEAGVELGTNFSFGMREGKPVVHTKKGIEPAATPDIAEVIQEFWGKLHTDIVV